MCKNEYRKHKFRQEINGRIVTHTEVMESKVHEELDHARLSKAVEELLDHFDDDDKNLFVLRCELEMPLAEIAVILNCPEGTVKSRWFYLKKKLAESLHDYNPAFK
jgi:RNA polymerase sigma-70 factor (ECF subfamily)